jgi:hypothetical protein
VRTSGGTFQCAICGLKVGTYGRFQHYNKHVREGTMTKRVARNGSRWEFYKAPDREALATKLRELRQLTLNEQMKGMDGIAKIS